MNFGKLRGKMVENGYTIRTLADKMGMTFGTMVRRLDKKHRGKSFTVEEMNKIVDALRLSSRDINEIFFDKESHLCDLTKEAL